MCLEYLPIHLLEFIVLLNEEEIKSILHLSTTQSCDLNPSCMAGLRARHVPPGVVATNSSLTIFLVTMEDGVLALCWPPPLTLLPPAAVAAAAAEALWVLLGVADCWGEVWKAMKKRCLIIVSML